MSDLPAHLLFPDRDPCFGDLSNSSSICHVPTPGMIMFLNISNPASYLQAYCLDPPLDSCAFGYCSNPDVASPAVRVSTYFTTVVSAILILYSPEDAASTFFSQLLNLYTLIFAAILSIRSRTLTKPHAVVALALAASPFSLYLIIYVIRTILGNQTRLQTVFGRGKWLNRGAVLVLPPIWIAVLVFAALPNGAWHFQQRACDEIIAQGEVIRIFFLPFIVYFTVNPWSSAAVSVVFIGAWLLAIVLQRKEIWKKGNKRIPWRRIWRKVVEAYPFIQFCTVVLFPHAIWFLNIEIGILALLKQEEFSPTYGQLLALFVMIPPLIQLCLLLPRMLWWFLDLTWVRLLTCRRNKPFLGRQRARNASEFTSLEDGLPHEDTDSYTSKPPALASPRSTLYASSAGFRSEESVPLQRMPVT
ncbi:hypothetical protein FB451DRAFT_1409723 [Mycena latifolia]|nr:hypothetical protein FB451DRAFT_1409723 [Mycena latifolia]